MARAKPPLPAWLAEFEVKHGPVKRRVVPNRKAKPPEPSAEDAFELAWHRLTKGESWPSPVREYRFHPERLWRFDFAWPAERIALEVEGMGRHQTFVGYREDCAKYNAALLLGWRVLRFMAAEKRHVEQWVIAAQQAIFTLPVCIPTTGY